MSDSYASFLYIWRMISLTTALSSGQKQQFVNSLLRRWSQIYTPVHSLAFCCDPSYREKRSNVISIYDSQFVKLGNGSLTEQCIAAFQLLASERTEQDLLLVEFLKHELDGSALLLHFKRYHPRLVWAQLQKEHPKLSMKMMQLFRSPASTAGVERNHKIGKSVMSQRRCRMLDASVARQVAITNNMFHLRKKVRSADREKLTKSFTEASQDNTDGVLSTSFVKQLIQANDSEDLDPLLTSVIDIQNPEEILDYFLSVE
ncbi:hypothetical protein FGB62_247g00 [Gracilaria domingensis]|nr:hypothetical protein FGB62_247g00 [Gracilaria domingensis]